MNDVSAKEIGAWVMAAGLAGATEPELLRGFCERAVAAGLPLARAVVLIDTLHPVHEGHVFHWRRDPTPDERTIIEYGRTSEGSEHAVSWRRSPFYHLLKTGGSALRHIRRLIESSELPAHRIGRSVRISEDDLARYLASTRHA